jgi:hypothetical protein
MSSSVAGVDPTTLGNEITVRVAKLSQDAQKAEGEAALQLIQSAQPSPPAPSPDGKGALLNRYA